MRDNNIQPIEGEVYYSISLDERVILLDLIWDEYVRILDNEGNTHAVNVSDLRSIQWNNADNIMKNEG